jgi:predicted nucleic acid-binding protein
VIHGVDTSFLVQLEVVGHPGHEGARRLRDKLLERGDSFALAPQVLAELVHIVTDARRFERPLVMAEARQRAEQWWNAAEVVHTMPNEHTVPRYFAWLREHGLGRKRLLDTLLAATYFAHGVRSMVTSNVRDFEVYGCFKVLRSG